MKTVHVCPKHMMLVTGAAWKATLVRQNTPKSEELSHGVGEHICDTNSSHRISVLTHSGACESARRSVEKKLEVEKDSHVAEQMKHSGQ